MINPRIEELYTIIREAQAELYELRDVCEHGEGNTVTLYGDHRSSYPTRLCNLCHEPIVGGKAITYEEAVACETDSFTYTDPAMEEERKKEIEKKYNYLRS